MITMQDIAVRAGVSRSTVSFVLNDKHSEMGVNEATRRRVLQTAREMGYRRNELARAIATGKNPVLAFFVLSNALHSEVTARVLAGILDEAEANQYVVQILRLSGGAADEEAVRRCVELRPTGVLGMYVDPNVLRHLQQEMPRFHIPVIVLESSFPIEGGVRILSDDILGCAQAIDHLAELGHTRIAFIGGRDDTVASVLRDEGYHRAMNQHGFPVRPGYAELGFWNNEAIEQATRRLFALSPRPTAIFCADDRTAMVACRILRELGLRIPNDVSLVGFADLTMAALCDPPLTTIAQPFGEMGRIAVRRLLAESAHKEKADITAEGFTEEPLPTRLVVRRSTAPVKS